MLRGVRTGLFHAVVGLGVASCGGVTSTSKDAGANGSVTDATLADSGGAGGDGSFIALDSAAADATSYDDGSNDDAADDAVEALDASFDAHPDTVWIPPVQ